MVECHAIMFPLILKYIFRSRDRDRDDDRGSYRRRDRSRSRDRSRRRYRDEHDDRDRPRHRGSKYVSTFTPHTLCTHRVVNTHHTHIYTLVYTIT